MVDVTHSYGEKITCTWAISANYLIKLKGQNDPLTPRAIARCYKCTRAQVYFPIEWVFVYMYVCKCECIAESKRCLFGFWRKCAIKCRKIVKKKKCLTHRRPICTQKHPYVDLQSLYSALVSFLIIWPSQWHSIKSPAN